MCCDLRWRIYLQLAQRAFKLRCPGAHSSNGHTAIWDHHAWPGQCLLTVVYLPTLAKERHQAWTHRHRKRMPPSVLRFIPEVDGRLVTSVHHYPIGQKLQTKLEPVRSVPHAKHEGIGGTFWVEAHYQGKLLLYACGKDARYRGFDHGITVQSHPNPRGKNRERGERRNKGGWGHHPRGVGGVFVAGQTQL